MQPIEIIRKKIEFYYSINGNSQNKLAEKCKISSSILTRLLNEDDYYPGLDTLMKIAKGLGLTLIQLLDDGNDSGRQNERIVTAGIIDNVATLLINANIVRPANPSDLRDYINMADATDEEIEAKKDVRAATQKKGLKQVDRKLPTQFSGSLVEIEIPYRKAKSELIGEIVLALSALDYDELNSVSSSIKDLITDRPSRSKATLTE